MAAIQQIIVKRSIQDVFSSSPKECVVTPAAIEQIIACCSIDRVVSSIGKDLLTFLVTDKSIGTSCSNGDTTIGKKVIQPSADITEGGIGVTIFILEILRINLEANMVDAIGYRIDKILAKVLGVCPIILNQMKTCFLPIFIIPV